MFGIAQANNTPIHIDTPSRILDVFLNLASVSIPMTPDADFDDTVKLLTLAEQFDCMEMKPKILARLVSLGETNAWRLLEFASDRQSVGLATIALTKMPNDLITYLGGMSTFWIRLRYLRPDWQLEILRCLQGLPEGIF